MSREVTQKIELYRVLASEGVFVKKVDKGTPNSRERTYLNPKTEKEETVTEDVVKAFTGYIRNIELQEQDWGEVIMVTLVEDDGNQVSLSFNADSNFGTDLMKKLPNVDFLKLVRLAPYSFETKEGKKMRGVTIEQAAEKVTSFFSEKDGDSYKSINGFPEPKGDTSKFTKKNWRDYFGVTVYNFLRDHTVEKVLPVFEDLGPMPIEVNHLDREKDSAKVELTDEEIPF